MRELTLIGLDVDGKHVICEGGDPADKFLVRVDDRLRAAVRGDRAGLDREQQGQRGQRRVAAQRHSVPYPGGRIGFQEVAEASGMDVSKIERFAHPVLLERQRAAELATAAHPVLADGPAVETLLETISTALAARGLSSEATNWDAWRTDDGRWTVRMGWSAGLSENFAHFRFTPGAHGGTVTAIDEAASELIDPEFERPLRQVAPLAQLECEPPQPVAAPRVPLPLPLPNSGTPPRPPPSAAGAKPEVPAWEDVLLGVRTSGER